MRLVLSTKAQGATGTSLPAFIVFSSHCLTIPASIPHWPWRQWGYKFRKKPFCSLQYTEQPACLVGDVFPVRGTKK